jgi:hypothetical protein
VRKIIFKTWKETTLVVLVILFALFLSKFPSLYYSLNTPFGYFFVGHASWFDPWDIQVYLSAMRYGEHYGFFLQNAYTTLPHNGELIYLFYTSLGMLNRIVHIPPIVLFQITSTIAAIILMIVIYLLIKLFFENIFIRIFTFITAVLGGGFGWIETFRSAADLQSAGLTMVNAFERGHDAISTACFLLSILLFIKFLSFYNKKLLVWAIVVGLVNCIIHPPFILLYMTAGTALALIGYLKYKKKNVFFYPLIITLIFSFYYFIFLIGLKDNIGYYGIVNQELFPVEITSLLLGMGIIVPFTLLSIIRYKDKNFNIFMIKIIFIIQFALLYIPTGYNLYFLKGLYIWAVILAFFEIQKLFTSQYVLKMVIIIVVVTSILTRIYTFNELMHINKDNSLFFLRDTEGKVLQSLEQFPPGNILSLFTMGNYIPAYSDDRVYLGHTHQTPYSKPRLYYASKFFVIMNSQERREFISENKINYIYYGLEEKKWREKNLLPDLNPFPEYTIIYNKNGIIIYKT